MEENPVLPNSLLLPVDVSHTASHTSPTTTSYRAEKSPCSICREEGDGFHFGAEACRACAAFFRRSVSLGKKYLCRADGKCEITANIRCMCRACRFTRCIEVGMNPAGVQQRRDTLGKRDLNDSPGGQLNLSMLLGSPKEEPSSSSPMPIASPLRIIASEETMPILEKMRKNYTKMDNARLVIHRTEKQSLFVHRVPKSVTYKEAAAVMGREVSLVADWISWCFPDFVMLPVEQKRVLFRNFYVGFGMLESSYLCHINDQKDVMILASGDYIDLKNLEKFFDDPSAEPQSMTLEECAKMFRPGFEMHQKSLVRPMMIEKVDVYEFFALCTLHFWEFGLEGQSDECCEVGRSVKNRVLKELTFYMKYVKKVEEPAMRVANLVTILPALQRCVRRFQEDIEISQTFNIYANTEEFYNLVHGKF